MIRIEFRQSYLSIKNFDSVDLPDFTLLIGRNGVGKTQLLDAIKREAISVSGIPSSEIEKYDINSFQPKNSGQGDWGNSIFAGHAAERFFLGKAGLAPAKIAEKIFEETTENHELYPGTENRRRFEEELRNKIGRMQDFSSFLNAIKNGVLANYSQQIQNAVIKPLRGFIFEYGNPESDPAALVYLAMKLTKKLPHEICRADILRAANYEGDTIANTLSQVFTRYKVEQFSWAHTEGEASSESFQNLMSRYLDTTPPPWSTLREILEQMREAAGDPELFNFEFSDPGDDRIDFANHQQYAFATRFTNRATGESYSVESLSSGEKILVALCLASFNQSIGRRQPKLILLDELDSVLHPSMISALIAGLKSLFVENGTKVIMATHSVTTAALFEEDKIYRMARSNNKIEIRPVTKSEAVSELSEGLATIDTGLKIAASDAKPITILTEGKNALHLKKWASLFFPGDVDVFEGLPDKTGKDQLKTYGDFLSKVNTNSHFLMVWDCDAMQTAKKLADQLPEAANVTAFSFKQRENKISPDGIENKYDEEMLKPFAIRAADYQTDREISLSLNKEKKTKFAEHIFSNGTKEDFQHFDDLKAVVCAILERQLTQQC